MAPDGKRRELPVAVELYSAGLKDVTKHKDVVDHAKIIRDANDDLDQAIREVEQDNRKKEEIRDPNVDFYLRKQ